MGGGGGGGEGVLPDVSYIGMCRGIVLVFEVLSILFDVVTLGQGFFKSYYIPKRLAKRK